MFVMTVFPKWLPTLPWIRMWRMALLVYVYMYVRSKPLQSCPTPCDAMHCSPPGSSVHGILQARILEWVAMPSSRGSSWPRDRSCISFDSSIADRFLNPEPLGKPRICVHTHIFWCPKALPRPRNTIMLVSREYKKDFFFSCLRILVIFNWRNLRSSFISQRILKPNWIWFT